MAWIEFHQALPRHPKTLRVALALNIPRAQVCGHLATLWTWALDARPEGGPLDAIDVIAGADWENQRKDFPAALVAAGFLDVRADGMWLHDWDDYAGRLRDQRELRRESNRQSQRRRRERLSAPRQHENADSQHDMSASQHSTLPNPTVPNPTEQNQTRDQKPEGARKRAIAPLPVDEDFIASLVSDYSGTWTEAEVRERVEAALNHKASDRWKDKRLGVKNWLRRDAQSAPRSPTPIRQPTGYLKPVPADAYAHLIHRSYE